MSDLLKPRNYISIIFVTGMTGAGQTTALKYMEDLGYETIDNLPLDLLFQLFEQKREEKTPLCVSFGVRSYGFNPDLFLKKYSELKDTKNFQDKYKFTLLYLDCEDTSLVRRFKETRHFHPLAMDRPILDGIQNERKILRSIQDKASDIIDTSTLTPWELKQVLHLKFAHQKTPELMTQIISFSYRRGIPREADLVFDVRFLQNPHYIANLRSQPGLNEEVGNYISEDPDFEGFMVNLKNLLKPLIPRYKNEGKSYLTIAFGCTGGRHRSVFIAEKIGKWLTEMQHHVTVIHRDLKISH